MHTINIIYGSGKHARIVDQTLLDLDPNADNWFVGLSADVDKKIVIDEQDIFSHYNQIEVIAKYYIGMGDLATRMRLFNQNIPFSTLIARTAVIHRTALIGEGSQILTNACVLSGAILGIGVIVNTGAQVDHDCKIGDFSHIAGGCALGGTVTVGSRTLLGVGTVVYPEITIGEDCIVATNTPIYKNIPDKKIIRSFVKY